jgi:hypothetical protein
VVVGLRGDDLLLNTRQKLLRFGQRQTQVGDITKTIRPADLHDVETLGLTIDPRSNQPQSPPHPRSSQPAKCPTDRTSLIVIPPISGQSPLQAHKPLKSLNSFPDGHLDMLDDPKHWPEGSGLYCVMNAGDVTANHNRFQLVPYTNSREEISGLGVNFMGLDFILLLEPSDFSLIPQLKRGDI